MRIFTVFPLFFIFSVNLLVAREWGTLFRWQTPEGIKWMHVGMDSLHDRYEGRYQKGLPEGQGRMIYINGETYAGEWKAGLYQGMGTLIRNDGSIHVGRFDSGHPHGLGVEKLVDGKKIQGEWRNGTQWNVTRYDSNGGIIEKLAGGEVVMEIDYGEIRFREWRKDHWVWLAEGKPGRHGKYQGEVQGLLPHGKGTYLSPLGVKYVGLWVEGVEHGHGNLTHPNGMRSVGEFRNGQPWNSVAYNSKGQVLFRVIRGQIHKLPDR